MARRRPRAHIVAVAAWMLMTKAVEGGRQLLPFVSHRDGSYMFNGPNATLRIFPRMQRGDASCRAAEWSASAECAGSVTPACGPPPAASGPNGQPQVGWGGCADAEAPLCEGQCARRPLGHVRSHRTTCRPLFVAVLEAPTARPHPASRPIG